MDRQLTGSSSFGNDLVWLSVLIQRRYAQICSDHGLTPTQATLLCVIAERPCRLGELARALELSKNVVSGLVDRIERRGLAYREIQSEDRRAAMLRLTEQGSSLVSELYSDVGDRLSAVADPLARDDRKRLSVLVADLVGTSATNALAQSSGDDDDAAARRDEAEGLHL